VLATKIVSHQMASSTATMLSEYARVAQRRGTPRRESVNHVSRIVENNL